MNALAPAFFVAMWLLNVAAFSQNAEGGQGYNAFRLLRARNIFDPERRSIKPDSPPRVPTPSGPRVTYAALTGTMVTESKSLAFFSGSPSEYNRVLGPGETIANAKITRVTTTGVELERDGNPIVIAVGQQLPLSGSEPPSSAVAPNAPPPPASPVSPQSLAAGTPPAAPNPGAQSDVLKRMMERRRQETSK